MRSQTLADARSCERLLCASRANFPSASGPTNAQGSRLAGRTLARMYAAEVQAAVMASDRNSRAEQPAVADK